MNPDLKFPHHNYLTDPLSESYELISSEAASANEDPQPNDVVEAASKLRSANVCEIILVHGTFAGNDIIGIVREIARLSPSLANSMRKLGKRVFDQLAGELGNYTQDFADRFSELIANEGNDSNIPVTRFSWSGENHHLGRAGGAISLIDYLTSKTYPENARIQIWGHSHGANLMAMFSQLIVASPAARDAFFAATRSHYRDPVFGRLDLPQWEQVRQRLEDPSLVGDLPAFDVVTFGAPLRYRWNSEVCENLLHFVQHRPLIPDKPSRANLPESIEDILTAKGGDYVQQLGIGGTDFLHAVFAWRSWNAERRIRNMFAAGIRRRDLTKSLKRGVRVSPDGTTLLVDYPETEEKWNQKLIGHGVYTRHEWLPFHLHAITDRFYG